MKQKPTPLQTAQAILRAYARAQGKHPRSHTAAEYRALAIRLAPIVCAALIAHLSSASQVRQ